MEWNNANGIMAHRFKTKSQVQSIDDDRYFPLSPELPDSTIPHSVKARLEPWFTLARRLYFPNATRPIAFNGLTRPQSRLDKPPKSFTVREPWKTVKVAEIRHLTGFAHVVPNGMNKRRFPMPSRNRYYQPTVHELHYTHKQFQPPTVHSRNEINDVAPSHDNDEPLARAHLASSKTQFLLSQGHSEDAISEDKDNCSSFIDVDERPSDEERELMREHQIPLCFKNKSHNVHIGNLNMNVKDLDNGSKFIHSYTSVFDLNVDQEMLEHLEALHDDRGDSHIGSRNIRQTKLGLKEVGFIKIDAGLEMSMSKRTKEALQEEHYPYLDQSTKFHDERMAYEIQSIKGPPLSTPSQVYRFFFQ